jgi:hypothetical protein
MLSRSPRRLNAPSSEKDPWDDSTPRCGWSESGYSCQKIGSTADATAIGWGGSMILNSDSGMSSQPKMRQYQTGALNQFLQSGVFDTYNTGLVR